MKMKICSICRRKLPFKAFTIIENGYNTDGLKKNQMKKEIVCKLCETQSEYRELITVKKTVKLFVNDGELIYKKDVGILDMSRDFFYLIANSNYTKITKMELSHLLKKGVLDIYNEYIVVIVKNYKFTKAKMEKEQIKKARNFIKSFARKNEEFKDISILDNSRDYYFLYLEEGGSLVKLTWTQIEILVSENLIECYNHYIMRLKECKYKDIKGLIAVKRRVWM